MLDLWYKQAIIYSLDVETFQDANGDGIGDFTGLTNRLDYLATLGITCIWLLPFYPTPNRDNGYDITDYYTVDPRLGSLGDFVLFTRGAHDRGMRVIVDLVINHTSDQHPWFQAARTNPDSPFHEYYVWSKEKPDEAHTGMVFPGKQESTWTYDEAAGAYYHHRFYKHQPDLNIANPAVRAEIAKIMGFWLELGVSGFRVDAAPFVIELHEMDGDKTQDHYAYLRDLREFLSWRRGDAILLAEANVPPDKIDEYFGDGTKMHMLFNFLLNQHLFLALARGEAEPLQRALQAIPPIPPSSQWANFIRNHDELDLGRLSKEELADVRQAFNLTDDTWLYERGPRRRLPPMLHNDQRRIALAYSLLFTLPGTPVLRYGEEIGMGDDLSLPERESVRTPMQWDDTTNGGFSSAPAEKLVLPVIHDDEFGYKRVNVMNQEREGESLLNCIEQMIRARRLCPEFGWGEWRLLDTQDPAVLMHCCEWRGNMVIAVHNFSAEPRSVTLDLADRSTQRIIDVLNDSRYSANGEHQRIDLEGYGYRWFRI